MLAEHAASTQCTGGEKNTPYPMYGETRLSQPFPVHRFVPEAPLPWLSLFWSFDAFWSGSAFLFAADTIGLVQKELSVILDEACSVEKRPEDCVNFLAYLGNKSCLTLASS
jgi:hypothetical protein